MSCLMMILKRPSNGRLDHILSLVTESANLLIYLSFLSLHLMADDPESATSRSNLGYFMIALILVIILRCLVELVVSLIKMVRYIRKYCGKSSRVAPVENQNKV